MKKKLERYIKRAKKYWLNLTLSNRLLILIGALAFITRFYRIKDKELWFDEVLDIIQAQKSVPEIFADVKITPVHYLFVHFSSLFSSNIEWLRLPSILFGVASVILLFYTIRKIADNRVALFSAFMLALSPMVIEFSQQILHYSYFVFFTILTLYFYFDIIFEKKLRLKTVLLFILATILNIGTHLSAFLVLQLQGIFLIIYYIAHLKASAAKLKAFFSNRTNTFAALLFITIVILIANRISYLHVFTNYSQFNLSAPITLGYSLTAQLKTQTITTFSLAFYKALFTWFGNGGGFQLILFFSLFLIGLVLLAVRRFWTAVFVAVWVGGPFLLLYLSRLSHWFEEKYFIFVIPIYLFTISYAVISLIGWFVKKTKDGRAPAMMYAIVAVFFLYLSTQPISTRTTYGYLVEGDQQFSWKKALDSIRSKMGHDDVVMAIDDKFLRAYMGRENRNKTWMSEEELIHYTPEQYWKLVTSSHVNYYLSIPDVVDMRIGPLATYSREGLVGGFNTYRVNFQKSTPVDFTGRYVDNFMKMNYLRDAEYWNNVIMSYTADINVSYPQTEEENLYYLVPKSNNNPYIRYKFKIKDSGPLYLRVNSFAKKRAHIEIEVEKNGKKTILDNPISTQTKQDFHDTTYDLSEFSGPGIIGITFKFVGMPKTYTNQLEAGLKSFGLLTKPYSEPAFEEIPEPRAFVYDANLEVGKDNKWWTETYSNFGWVQTRFGILYRKAGDDNDALVYRFALPAGSSASTLMTETFTKDNAMNIAVSNSDSNYHMLARHVSELKEIEHTYDIPPQLLSGQEFLFVRIQSDKQGQFGALRNLVLTLKNP